MKFDDLLLECMHVTLEELQKRGIREVFDGPFHDEKGKLAYPQFDIDQNGVRGFVFVYPTVENVSECSEFHDQEQLKTHIEWCNSNNADFYAAFVRVKSSEPDGKFYFDLPIEYFIKMDMIPCLL